MIGRSAWSTTKAPRVGIAWSVLARDRHAFVTAHKSIPAAAFAPLIEAARASALCRCSPAQSGDAAAFGRWRRASRTFADRIRDFGDTAALVSQVDLVIAPDTAVAHLAGALGKPVWLLDRYNCCWRWRLAPASSPWYPTLSIHRQTRFGDWSGVIERVRVALERWRSERAAAGVKRAMPELPDVVVYCEALAARVRGRRLARRAPRQPVRAAHGRAAARRGRGQDACVDVRRLGKRIVLALDDELFLVIHLMIAGRLRWLRRGRASRRQGSRWRCSISRTGTLAFTEAGTEAPRVAARGPG